MNKDLLKIANHLENDLNTQKEMYSSLNAKHEQL